MDQISRWLQLLSHEGSLIEATVTARMVNQIYTQAPTQEL